MQLPIPINASDINRYISHFLRLHSAFHDYNTCNRNSVVLPRVVRSWSQRSFLHRSVREFNSLPHENIVSRSLNVFKLKLKIIIFLFSSISYKILYELCCSCRCALSYFIFVFSTTLVSTVFCFDPY